MTTACNNQYVDPCHGPVPHRQAFWAPLAARRSSGSRWILLVLPPDGHGGAPASPCCGRAASSRSAGRDRGRYLRRPPDARRGFTLGRADGGASIGAFNRHMTASSKPPKAAPWAGKAAPLALGAHSVFSILSFLLLVPPLLRGFRHPGLSTVPRGRNANPRAECAMADRPAPIGGPCPARRIPNPEETAMHHADTRANTPRSLYDANGDKAEAEAGGKRPPRRAAMGKTEDAREMGQDPQATSRNCAARPSVDRPRTGTGTGNPAASHPPRPAGRGPPGRLDRRS